MAGFDNNIMYADNVDFTGSTTPSAKVLADGEILIGSTATPNIKVGSLTSLVGTIAITVGSGTIDLEVNGSMVGKTITGDSGGSLSPTAGNWNILGGTDVSTSGSGSTLTINSTATGFTWNEITGSSVNIVAANGYILDNASLVTATLPATCTIGDEFKIAGKGAGGWKLAQNGGDQIHYGSQSTTSGAGGSLASTNQFDCIEFVCTMQNTEWTVLSSIGNLTVV